MSIPHQVLGTTKDDCRYVKAVLTAYLGGIPGIDLSFPNIHIHVYIYNLIKFYKPNQGLKLY